jgi:small GTP-binding protein
LIAREANGEVPPPVSEEEGVKLGAEFLKKSYTIGVDIVEVQLWDTGAQERYRNLTTSFYRGASAVVIVFNVNDRESFDHVKREWLVDARRSTRDETPLFLIGNKIDSPNRVVTKEEALDLVKQEKIKNYFECSAKEGRNTSQTFQTITQTVWEFKKQISGLNVPPQPSPQEKTSKGGCCNIV